MNVLRTIADLRKARRALSGSVALVPTMGYLHEGHRSLMRTALASADHLIVSIFVNPRQFGPNEDLDNYPRDEAGDLNACQTEGAAIVFLPDPTEIYPPNYSSEVIVHNLGDYLCGASRPGHFEGVATVVTKLFHITTPDIAVFGQKDYQQVAIIQRLVTDLNLPVDIVTAPTVREADGLAMSSRNRYLSAQERPRAAALSRALLSAHQAFQNGERHPLNLIALAQRCIETHQAGRIDYIECVHPLSLRPYDPDTPIGPDGAVMALAVYVENARLIDNLRLDAPLPPGLSPLS